MFCSCDCCVFVCDLFHAFVEYVCGLLRGVVWLVFVCVVFVCVCALFRHVLCLRLLV